MACGRSGAAVTSVIMLLKASNKEARLTMDKVSKPDHIVMIKAFTKLSLKSQWVHKGPIQS